MPILMLMGGGESSLGLSSDNFGETLWWNIVLQVNWWKPLSKLLIYISALGIYKII